MQAYSNPDREKDPTALPDVEVFQIDDKGYSNGEPFVLPHEPGEQAFGLTQPGWYWWVCFPGCLPDGTPFGPFETEATALADAQDV
ncbi:hypothetical protein LCGC14_3111910 [marine sediment metagenome]|uniref:Uncharacterized protein n=1 Tax=marine sediment metagenome TaxID=412755 RepID=A0A0F8YUR7_9ZZZZ